MLENRLCFQNESKQYCVNGTRKKKRNEKRREKKISEHTIEINKRNPDFQCLFNYCTLGYNKSDYKNISIS